MPTTTTMDIYNMRQRRITTKSHYKMKCDCCGKTIHRGDEITQVLGSHGRMRVRVVDFNKTSQGADHFTMTRFCAHADAESGCFTPYAYAPTRNQWVHINCRPQCFQEWCGYGGQYCQIPTAYSYDIERRRSAAAMDPDWGENFWEIPRPKWTWQTERLAAAIIPLQQNWKRKNQQRKWEKSIMDATKILDNAITEVSYDWDKALLNHIWEIVRGERMPGSLPQRTGLRNLSRKERDANLEWGTRMMQAGWFLESVNRNKEHYWEKELMNKIIKTNTITGKPRTPLV